MKQQWMLDARGDPLAAIRSFLSKIWERASLDAMLIPLSSDPSDIPQPFVITRSEMLESANPFKPVLAFNIARFVPGFVRSSGGAPTAVLLRPCEMRALVEMSKRQVSGFAPNRGAFLFDNLITISIDCFGTFPLDEFQWRAQRKGSGDRLAGESLRFARQGGILPYRYRPACQICESPKGRGADINIGVLGLPARETILVEARTPAVAKHLEMGKLGLHPAELSLLEQRNRMLDKVEERNRAVRERVMNTLREVLPKNVSELASQMEKCGACRTCFSSCPICAVDMPGHDEKGRLREIDVLRWLISCAGCGMCEQACPAEKPLSLIFSHIRRELEQAYNYHAGMEPLEPMPSVAYLPTI